MSESKLGRVGLAVLFAPDFVADFADIDGYRLQPASRQTQKYLVSPQPPNFGPEADRLRMRGIDPANDCPWRSFSPVEFLASVHLG